MATIEELRQMPVVTVEQVIRFREAALAEIARREQQLISFADGVGHCVGDYAPDLRCKGCEVQCEHFSAPWPQ